MTSVALSWWVTSACSAPAELTLGSLGELPGGAASSAETSCAVGDGGDGVAAAMADTDKPGEPSPNSSDGAAGAGGSAVEPVADTDPEGDPVPYQVNAGGYVRSGPWFGYAWVDSDDLSVVSPSDFLDHPAGEPLCITGAVAADEEYGSFAMLGINLNQSTETETLEAWTVTSQGISYEITNPGSHPLRLLIQGELGYPYEFWCVNITEGSGTLAWSEFRTECWGSDGEIYDSSIPLTSIGVLAPGNDVSEVPFEFCVESIEPSDGVPTSPEETTPGSDSSGAGSGELMPGFEVAAGGFVTAGELQGSAWLSASVESGNGTTLNPKDYSAHPGGAPICASGVVGASPEYTDYAMTGLNVAQEASGGEPGLTLPQGDGLEYYISNYGDSDLRMQLQGAAGSVDENERWCAPITATQGFIPWSDFRTMCWDDSGTSFDATTPLQVIAVTVPSTGSAVLYDYCIHGVMVSG